MKLAISIDGAGWVKIGWWLDSCPVRTLADCEVLGAIRWLCDGAVDGVKEAVWSETLHCLVLDADLFSSVVMAARGAGVVPDQPVDVSFPRLVAEVVSQGVCPYCGGVPSPGSVCVNCLVV